MSLIQNWLLRHRHRQSKFVSLYDMMFDARNFPYLSFRLSLFNLQVIFHYFAHAIMFYFMSHKLSSRTFTALIFVNGLKMLIDSGWWGGLEVLRTQVRSAYHTGRKEEIGSIVGFWITLALFVAIPFVLIAGYFGYETYQKMLYNEPVFKPLFIGLISLSVAFHLPIEAFHSGIYGISRIMRPRFSMILPYLVGLCVLFALWSEFKIYAILLSILAEIVTSFSLTLYYTSYMYVLYNIKLKKPDHYEFRARFKELPIYHFFLGFVSNLCIMIDSVLIIAFYFLAFADMRLLFFMKIIYLISPLICASSDWARLFYFDRKQLENDQLSLFINQYDKSISRTASFLGFCFGIIATVSCYILISPAAAGYTLIMLPFFLLRSLIADRQVRAFTYNHYYDVIFSGILMIICWIGVYTLKAPLLTKGFIVAIGMIIVHGILKRYRFPSYHQRKYQNLYTNLYFWLSNLSQIEKPVELYKIYLDDYILPQQRIGLIRRLTEKFELSGDHICLNGDHPILFYREFDTTDPSPTPMDFAELGLGVVKKVESEYVGHLDSAHLFNRPIYPLEECPLLQDILQKPLNHYRDAENFPENPAEVIEVFKILFPTGIYYDPVRHLGSKAVPLPLDAVRKFTLLIWQYLFKQRGNSYSDTDLTVIYENGLIRVIFVFPRSHITEENSQKVRDWHRLIHAVNIRQSLIYKKTSVAESTENYNVRKDDSVEFA